MYALRRSAFLAAVACFWSSLLFGSDIFLEPGSEPGWRPADGAEQDVLEKMRSVLSEMNDGLYEQAYWNLDPSLKASMNEDQFAALNGPSREELGSMKTLRVLRVTWIKPRSETGLTGIYASVDITRTFERAQRDCGYIALHQAPDDPNWWVVRLDDHVMPDAIYDDMIRKGKTKEAEALWARLKQGCPNYR